MLRHRAMITTAAARRGARYFRRRTTTTVGRHLRPRDEQRVGTLRWAATRTFDAGTCRSLCRLSSSPSYPFRRQSCSMRSRRRGSCPSSPLRSRSSRCSISNRSSSSSKRADDVPPSPTRRQLAIHGINCAVPMIGFGFMDNLVMIQAGDAIDNSIGVAFCFSTLTAAALGQVISDASGVCFGGCIEAVANKLGLPSSTMTRAQLQTRSVRIFSTGCATVGVIIGCVLGMTSLLFMDLEKAEREKKKKKLAALFDILMEDGHTLLGAERCTLWLLCDSLESRTRSSSKIQRAMQDPNRISNIYMWSKSRKGEMLEDLRLEHIFKSHDKDGDGTITPDAMLDIVNGLGWGLTLSDLNELMRLHKVDVDDDGNITMNGFKQMIEKILLAEETIFPAEPDSMKYEVIRTKKLVNVPDLYSDQQFKGKAIRRTMDALTGWFTLSVLLAPVVNSKGEVLGLVEACNKVSEGVGYEAFNEEDEKLMTLLCSHAGRFIEAVSET